MIVDRPRFGRAARDQQPGQQAQVAHRHDRAAEDALVDDRRTGNHEQDIRIRQQLRSVLGDRRYRDAVLLLAGSGEHGAILVAKDDTAVYGLAAKRLLLDQLPKTLIDEIERGVEAVLRRHAQRPIDQVGFDLEAAGQLDDGLLPLGHEVGDRCGSPLAVGHQVRIGRGPQLRLRGMKAPQESQRERREEAGHDQRPVQHEASTERHGRTPIPRIPISGSSRTGSARHPSGTPVSMMERWAVATASWRGRGASASALPTSYSKNPGKNRRMPG